MTVWWTVAQRGGSSRGAPLLRDRGWNHLTRFFESRIRRGLPDMSLSVDMNPLSLGVTPFAPPPMRPTVLAVTVDFDKSVFLMMALFALLILILKPLLLDPMMRVFALREERTDGAKAEARAMQERAADILRNYEAEVAKVRAEATAERDALRKETVRLEAEILAEARISAAALAAEGRKRIEAEVVLFEKDLSTQSAAFSKDIGSCVLGRELS